MEVISRRVSAGIFLKGAIDKSWTGLTYKTLWEYMDIYRDKIYNYIFKM